MTDPATVYDSWFVPALFAPMAQQLLAETAIPSGARVLDVACGSGIVARLVATRLGPSGRVTGIDVNPGMIAAARRASDEAAVAIDWQVGSALDLPFADQSFDLVVCQQGLQFFPDRAKGVAEMYRVLAPGGEVCIATWRGLDQNPFFAEMERVVRQRTGATALQMPFSLGDPLELATLMQDAGFRDVSVAPFTVTADHDQPERYIELQVGAMSAGVVAMQSLTDSERSRLITAVGDDLADHIASAREGDRLRFPMQGIVARGVRR